jgi:hypothetical protein
MCMMCEEEFMYQAYLDYLARKAAGEGGLAPEERAFLEASGLDVNKFACDPVPEGETAQPASPFSRLGPKAS